MKYDPIKKILGRFFSKSLFSRRLFYGLLDLLLLRTWHVKKALKEVSGGMKSQSTILDAGCGFGQYTWRMQKMNREWKIDAVDIDAEHITDCEKFFTKAGLSNRVSFGVMDLTKLNAANRYNVILSVDVMEHIEDDLKVFQNFYSALKENGAIIISTPSDKGGSDVHDEGDDSFVAEHVRDGYNIDDISRKLSSAGFRNVTASYTYGKAGAISWALSMKYPIKMLNASYLFFIFLPFWYLIFFPVSLVLNYIDVKSTHKTGTGLLVKAMK